MPTWRAVFAAHGTHLGAITTPRDNPTPMCWVAVRFLTLVKFCGAALPRIDLQRHFLPRLRPVANDGSPFWALAEIGHSVFQIRPLLEPKREWGDRRIYETLSPVTSASASRWGRLFWPLAEAKRATSGLVPWEPEKLTFTATGICYAALPSDRAPQT